MDNNNNLKELHGTLDLLNLIELKGETNMLCLIASVNKIKEVIKSMEEPGDE